MKTNVLVATVLFCAANFIPILAWLVFGKLGFVVPIEIFLFLLILGLVEVSDQNTALETELNEYEVTMDKRLDEHDAYMEQQWNILAQHMGEDDEIDKVISGN